MADGFGPAGVWISERWQEEDDAPPPTRPDAARRPALTTEARRALTARRRMIRAEQQLCSLRSAFALAGLDQRRTLLPRLQLLERAAFNRRLELEALLRHRARP